MKTSTNNNTFKTIRTAAFEVLDQRQLLSGTTFSDGNFSFSGSNNNDNISVSREGTSVVITANGNVVGSQPISSVRKITINAGNGNNRVEVSPNITISAIVTAGAGSDTITTGSGHDSVFGGEGNDRISTGDGNDYVNAGGGDDYISLGKGSDSAQGAAGKDTILAGRGTDTLRGGAHNDILVGYNGDYIEGGAGNDYISHNGKLPTVPTAQGQAAVGRVTGFSLVNADTGAVVKGYENMTGSVSLDLNKLPSRFSVRANVTGAVGSIRFEAPGTSRVESKAPFSLLGDSGTTYTPWSVGTGTKTIKATTYSNASATGTAGTSTSLSMNFIRTTTTTTPAPTPTPAPTTPTPTPTPSTTTNAGTAVIDVATSDLRTGQAVHVVGSRSTAKVGGVEDLKFSWNFGDAGSKYNILPGFNAAHVYSRAGTYTVTLTLTDSQGRTSVSSKQVTVQAAAVQKKIYVSSSGNDSAAGTEGAPVRTLEKALSLSSDNTTIYLKRGQTFTTSTGVVISKSNLTLTSYGTGNDAKVLYNGPREQSVILRINASSSNVVVSNLTFDSLFTDTDQVGVPHAIQPMGTNITIRDNTFLNVGHAINGNMKPTNMLILDNKAPSPTGVRAYFTWVSGTNYVIVGNVVANSTREHNIRAYGVTNLNVSFNDLTNLDRRPLGDEWDFSKGAMTIQKGKFGYLSNNKANAEISAGPLGGPTGMGDTSARFEHMVIENNEVSETATIRVRHGMEHVTVRNNVINTKNAPSINVEDFNEDYNRGAADVSILNNVAINTGTMGTFLKLDGVTSGVELVGNTYIAPNLNFGAYGAAAVYIVKGNLSSFTRIANNTWPVNTNLTGYALGGSIKMGDNLGANGYITAAQWNAYSVVGTDNFSNLGLYTFVMPETVGILA